MVSFLSFVTLFLAGMVVASPLELKTESNLEKRDMGTIQLDCQDGTKDAFFLASVAETKALALAAAGWIDYVGVDNSLFADYFGAGQNNGTLQSGRFRNLFNDTATVLSCNDPDKKCQPGDVSYSDYYGIHFCPRFFDESDNTSICKAKTIDSLAVRGATLLSNVELVHFGGNSSASCAQARRIAKSDPYAAAHNSDSYSCFAMQVYAGSNQCGSSN